MPDGASTTTRTVPFQDAPLRLFYADPERVPLEDAFRRAKVLGFSHVVIPPPWAASRHDRLLACSLDTLTPTLAPFGSLADIAAAARKAGVGLVLDVVLDRVGEAVAAANAMSSGVFLTASFQAMLDPRRGAVAGAATAQFTTEAGARTVAEWWAAQLSRWAASGVAGFRLLGLDSVPDEHVHSVASVLRKGVPASQLLAWTPGMRRSAIARLGGTGLDGVFPSLPWWDFQASWLWDEIADLRAVAPVIGSDAAPLQQVFTPGLQRAASARAQCERGMSVAATLGSGWLHVAAAGGGGADVGDLSTVAEALNKIVLRLPAGKVQPGSTGLEFASGDVGPVLAFGRTDGADHRSAGRALLVVINTDVERQRSIAGAALLPSFGGRFGAFHRLAGDSLGDLDPSVGLSLVPGGFAVFTAEAMQAPQRPAASGNNEAREAAANPRLAIEAPSPSVDDGRFPVKRTAGETVAVQADVLFDGHEKIAVALRWRAPTAASWQEIRMRPLGNDRWEASFPLTVLGRHDYVVSAWRDRFETFRDELAKKAEAGVDTRLELLEGEAMVKHAATRAASGAGRGIAAVLQDLSTATPDAKRALLLSPALAALMQEADDRPFLVETQPMPVDAERIGARFASWYEVFPRSMSDDPTRHGTFADVERHLPRVRDMGFDVLYFPPIHPIGRTNRKGRNNTLTPGPEDPGSPYAIGSADGGHDALHPQLGTLEDFQSLLRAAASHGLEIAIDFAVQCSPDHPWLKQHKGWFDWRPDGTIRYAENPPKKYEDIVNVDFYGEDAVPGLWIALRDVVMFWAEQGVRLFRVDNPHTKPFPFWEWMIGDVRKRFPDAAFLAEAFTRPKIMYRLAKIGFSQSYTYFTWRNTKLELQAYLTELAVAPPAEFFRPHFFVNTPDINPVFLHDSGRPGFLIRAALAATLSGLWGVYNGFELCEGRPIKAGKEEYIDSEKYEIRAWDWDRPGNIVAEISALNRIRKRNPALQTHLGVEFHVAHNDAILYFEKATADRSNVVLVAISLDPHHDQEADFEVPLWNFKLPDDGRIDVEDLLTGERFTWQGKTQHLRLTPALPYAIWRIRRNDA